MSEQLNEHSCEASLLHRARGRDPDAVNTLYSTHAVAARQVAIHVAGIAAADDLVADAFARVIAQLHAGRGPTKDFRSYLHATIRNRSRDIHRLTHRERPASHLPWILEDGLEPVDGPDARLRTTVQDEQIVAAFENLPKDWREVLWHLELRDRAPSEVATLMDLTPAAVSSLSYRAREGLRLAYLDQVLAQFPSRPACRWTRDRLSRYVREKVGARPACRIEAHLEECATCSAVMSDLEGANRRLAGLSCGPA